MKLIRRQPRPGPPRDQPGADRVDDLIDESP